MKLLTDGFRHLAGAKLRGFELCKGSAGSSRHLTVDQRNLVVQDTVSFCFGL
jgi:hypothetical protein